MLSERQGNILASIVREHTATAVPVGSTQLAKKYHPEISPATIRNEMGKLEKDGFIIKPHISSGRVPSDKGYRYFVDKSLKTKELSQDDQKRLQVELLKTKTQNVRLSCTLAKMLSATSHCMAISGVVGKKEFFDFGMHTLLEDPEFNELDDISKIFASLDLIDERAEELLAQLEDGETKIFIGKENPIKEIQKCSMIIAPYRSASGERGILAIVGPKRMHYGKNKTLIDFVKNIFGEKDKTMIAFVVSFPFSQTINF
ncbi:MAG: hypothetical protein U9O20_04355 [Patescibacteria group bacterium]|nr:hypothetical protein [Patescibacteria group bacterium]